MKPSSGHFRAASNSFDAQRPARGVDSSPKEARAGTTAHPPGQGRVNELNMHTGWQVSWVQRPTHTGRGRRGHGGRQVSLLAVGGHVANRTLEVPGARGADDPWAARPLAGCPATDLPTKAVNSDNGRQCRRWQGNTLPADVATCNTYDGAAQPVLAALRATKKLDIIYYKLILICLYQFINT